MLCGVTWGRGAELLKTPLLMIGVSLKTREERKLFVERPPPMAGARRGRLQALFSQLFSQFGPKILKKYHVNCFFQTDIFF